MKRTILFLCLLLMVCPFLSYTSTTGMASQVPTDSKTLKKQIQQLADEAFNNSELSPHRAIEYGKKAQKLLEIQYDKKLHIHVLNALSRSFLTLEDYSRAESHSRQSLELAKVGDFPSGLAMAYKILGVVHLRRNEYDDAWEAFDKALKLFEQLDDKKRIAKIYNNIGIIYSELSAHDKTLEYYLKSLRIYEDLQDQTNIAVLTNNIGVVREDLGKFDSALENYFNSLKIFRELKKDNHIANTLHNIGSTYYKLGDYPQAIKYSREALDIAREIDFKRGIALALNNIGCIYMAQKKYNLAHQHCSDALKIHRKLGSRQGMSETMRNIGQISKHIGQYSTAIHYLKEALNIAVAIKNKNEIRECFYELSVIYADIKDHKTALHFHRKYKDINDVIFNEGSIKRIAELQIKYNSEKNEREIEILKKDSEIRKLDLEQQRTVMKGLIAASALVVIVVFVFYSLYQVKSRMTRRLREEIEEHRRTYKMLRESEAKFRILAEKSLVGIYIMQDSVFKYINPQFIKTFGYPADQLIDKKSIIDLAMKHERSTLEERFRDSGDNPGSVLHYEFQGTRKSGATIYLESYHSAIHYHDRPAVMGTIIDVTDRKRTEKEFIKRRKLESIGIVAGNIANDFNNLLDIIRGGVNKLKLKLKRRKKDPDIEDAFENLERSAAQASELAQKLITFAEGGWLQREPTSFNTLLKAAIDYLPSLREREYDIRIPNDLMLLYVDPNQFREVLQNLLLNATEADPEKHPIIISAENISLTPAVGSPAIRIRHYIKIVIKDKGVGIPGDRMEQIFDPYFSTKDTYSQKGMGLGLSICYAIIKKHEGYISLESEPGKGTSVFIQVPAHNETLLSQH